MPKWRPEKIRLISKELSVLGITMSILLFAITTSSVTVKTQLQTHQTLLEMRVHQLIKLLQKLDTNASNAMNETGEAVNATASDIGSTILNKTVEVGKK